MYEHKKCMSIKNLNEIKNEHKLYYYYYFLLILFGKTTWSAVLICFQYKFFSDVIDFLLLLLTLLALVGINSSENTILWTSAYLWTMWLLSGVYSSSDYKKNY